MYFSMAMAAAAVVVAFGMEWLNVKKIAEEREILPSSMDNKSPVESVKIIEKVKVETG